MLPGYSFSTRRFLSKLPQGTVQQEAFCLSYTELIALFWLKLPSLTPVLMTKSTKGVPGENPIVIILPHGAVPVLHAHFRRHGSLPHVLSVLCIFRQGGQHQLRLNKKQRKITIKPKHNWDALREHKLSPCFLSVGLIIKVYQKVLV